MLVYDSCCIFNDSVKAPDGKKYPIFIQRFREFPYRTCIANSRRCDYAHPQRNKQNRHHAYVSSTIAVNLGALVSEDDRIPPLHIHEGSVQRLLAVALALDHLTTQRGEASAPADGQAAF